MIEFALALDVISTVICIVGVVWFYMVSRESSLSTLARCIRRVSEDDLLTFANRVHKQIEWLNDRSRAPLDPRTIRMAMTQVADDIVKGSRK